jgi:aconitase A
MTVKGEVEVETDTGLKFMTDVRIDTQPEMNYYRSGGILVYVL